MAKFKPNDRVTFRTPEFHSTPGVEMEGIIIHEMGDHTYKGNPVYVIVDVTGYQLAIAETRLTLLEQTSTEKVLNYVTERINGSKSKR